MKRILILSICAATVLAGCNSAANSNSTAPATDTSKLKAEVELPKELHTELYGIYSGMFETPEDITTSDSYQEPVKITINITRITETGVEGKSAVRGNVRPMSGTLSAGGNGQLFVMDEPGSDKHDGRFNFKIVGDSLIGTWEAYDRNAVKEYKKNYRLVKTPFIYNPNLMLPDEIEYVDYQKSRVQRTVYKGENDAVDTSVTEFYRSASDVIFKLNASKTLLTEKQLKNLRKLDLEILRNSIYARHGYAFKSPVVRQFFDGVDWYQPISDNVEGDLTAVEKQNVELLKRFEKYAKDNYDYFGR